MYLFRNHKCYKFFTKYNNVKRLSSTNTSNLLQELNDEISNGGVVPIFKLAPIFKDRIAVQDSHGKIAYNDLFKVAKKLSFQISDALNGHRQKTVSYLCNGDSTHIITQWAIWMSGNIAVPLSLHHPQALLEYYIKDSEASLIIYDEKLMNKLPNLSKDNITMIKYPSTLIANIKSKEMSQDPESLEEGKGVFENLPDGKFYANNDALIIYTSGTTSKPKGVVHGFKQLNAQVASLHAAWKYTCNDVLLHTLPLHHIHGLVVSVCAALGSGAMLRMLPSFNPALVWSHLLGMEKNDHRRVSFFMGVPTMYNKLIDEYDKVLATTNNQKEYIRNILMTKIRIMVSGSAPLPVPVFERWEEITGHRLLERYGMTEIGMALSNPYEPQKERTPGFVGQPLPGVSVQLASVDLKNVITPLIMSETLPPNPQINLDQYNFCHEDEIPQKNLFTEENTTVKNKLKCNVVFYNNTNQDNKISGELLVKGPNVFDHYWNRPEQTKAEFTNDGWFRTGDTAMYENGIFKILGRTSVDIIKSGGYKISALELETTILGHPNIVDVAVLGMPDVTWGEKIVAVIQLENNVSLTLKELKDWGEKYIPKYQLPSELYIVSQIQRNVMGKVNKKELQKKIMKELQKS